MNLQNFKKRYALTLHTDTETKENYIRLPLDDLEEMGYMQQALISGIKALTQVEDMHKKESENSIYWLCRILLCSHPQDELEGLSEWLKDL